MDIQSIFVFTGAHLDSTRKPQKLRRCAVVLDAWPLFTPSGLWFKVNELGCNEGLRFRVWGSKFKVSDLGFKGLRGLRGFRR